LTRDTDRSAELVILDKSEVSLFEFLVGDVATSVRISPAKTRIRDDVALDLIVRIAIREADGLGSFGLSSDASLGSPVNGRIIGFTTIFEHGSSRAVRKLPISSERDAFGERQLNEFIAEAPQSPSTLVASRKESNLEWAPIRILKAIGDG
jgi:hypothetical protein